MIGFVVVNKSSDRAASRAGGRQATTSTSSSKRSSAAYTTTRDEAAAERGLSSATHAGRRRATATARLPLQPTNQITTASTGGIPSRSPFDSLLLLRLVVAVVEFVSQSPPPLPLGTYHQPRLLLLLQFELNPSLTSVCVVLYRICLLMIHPLVDLIDDDTHHPKRVSPTPASYGSPSLYSTRFHRFSPTPKSVAR